MNRLKEAWNGLARLGREVRRHIVVMASTKKCWYPLHHDPAMIGGKKTNKMCVVCSHCSMHMSMDRALEGCVRVPGSEKCPFGPNRTVH